MVGNNNPQTLQHSAILDAFIQRAIWIHFMMAELILYAIIRKNKKLPIMDFYAGFACWYDRSSSQVNRCNGLIYHGVEMKWKRGHFTKQ